MIPALTAGRADVLATNGYPLVSTLLHVQGEIG